MTKKQSKELEKKLSKLYDMLKIKNNKNKTEKQKKEEKIRLVFLNNILTK